MAKNSNLKENLKLIANSTKAIKGFMKQFIDADSFVETDVFSAGVNYIDGTSALGEGVVTGYCSINGSPVHMFAQNSEVMKGSVGKAHSLKIIKCIERAVKSGLPLVSVIDCSGARIGEGVTVIEGYAEILKAISNAKEEIQHICIIKGNNVGMMSSFSALADFVFMSSTAVMSVNSPTVLASKLNEFPKFESILGVKKYAEKSLAVSFDYKNDKDLASKLKDLFDMLNGDNNCEDDANRETATLDKSFAVNDVVQALADTSKTIEVYAQFATETKCFLAKINGIAVAIVANDSSLNDGFMSLNGIEKATKFIKLADSLALPLITLVDTKGVKTCLDSEVEGANAKCAELFNAIALSCNEKIAVIIGKAIGFGYASLASKGIGFDYTLAFANAVISPLNAETAINLVYADELKGASEEKRAELENKYAVAEANPFISAKDGYIDNIIEPSTIRPYVASALLMLLGI